MMKSWQVDVDSIADGGELFSVKHRTESCVGI